MVPVAHQQELGPELLAPLPKLRRRDPRRPQLRRRCIVGQACPGWGGGVHQRARGTGPLKGMADPPPPPNRQESRTAGRVPCADPAQHPWELARCVRPRGKRPRGKRPRGKRPRGKRPRGKRPRGKRPRGKRTRGEKGRRAHAIEVRLPRVLSATPTNSLDESRNATRPLSCGCSRSSQSRTGRAPERDTLLLLTAMRVQPQR